MGISHCNQVIVHYNQLIVHYNRVICHYNWLETIVMKRHPMDTKSL